MLDSNKLNQEQNAEELPSSDVAMKGNDGQSEEFDKNKLVRKNSVSLKLKSESKSNPISEDSMQIENLENKFGKKLRRVDLKNDVNIQDYEGQQESKKPSALKSIRFYIIVIALISPFVTTYSRTIINFAITDMVNPEFVETQRVKQQSDLQTANSSFTDQSYFDHDNSCPVSESDRERLIKESKIDINRAKSTTGEKYDWDSLKQGLLKAAFTIGHTPLQVYGSRLSEIYGSHRIMSSSTLLIALCCIAAPYLAAINFYLIFADLVFLGVLGSFMSPALISMFANWLTPSEKSIVLPFYLIASRLGYALSSVLCGLLIQAEYSWKYVFFSAGWISLAYSSLFFVCARSRPKDHPLVGQVELNYLAGKNTLVRESLLTDQIELRKIHANSEAEQKKTSRKAPWKAIMTNVSVWTFIVTKFCVKFAGDTVQIELPTYLKRVMHFSAKNNGFINGSNYVIFCGGCMMIGLVGKIVIKKRPFGLSKTTLRKCFQFTASTGVALVLIGLAFSVCNDTLTLMWLMLLFFLTTFGMAGEAQIPLDITERYSGTIHAIGSSLAISGAIEPTLVGFLLRGKQSDRDSWKAVWLGASLISFIGGLVFVVFADCTIQPFDSISDDKKKFDQKDKKGQENEAYETDLNDERIDIPELSNTEDKPTFKESIQI